MQQDAPFKPGANTFVIPCGATATAATRPGLNMGGEVDYVIYNKGAADAWIGYGPTSDAAIANAVIPLIGSPQSALPSPAGTIQTFTLDGSIFFSGIGEGGLTSCTITPGYGA